MLDMLGPSYYNFFRWSISQIPTSHRCFIDLPSPETMVDNFITRREEIYWHPSGAGFGLCRSGEIKYLHSSKEVSGRQLLQFIVSLQDHPQLLWLSAFDVDTLTGQSLIKWYEKFGFKECLRHTWAPNLAPKCWDETLWGTPDVVEMKYVGDSL